MPEFTESELWRFFKLQFANIQTQDPRAVLCLVPAKNKKKRDVALICQLQENSDATSGFVPIARMIDPAHRGNYDISEVLVEGPEKKAA